MKYTCAGCGSIDSRHDWANSQFGDYYCPECLDGGGSLSQRQSLKNKKSPVVLGIAFFLVTVFGLVGLVSFVFP
jgi:late competence protein required for DNA uptake (superfamily II DNA/RNA helicase)